MKKNLDYYGLFKPNSNWHKFILTMKITAFLLFSCLANIFAAPTYSQTTKISLHLKDATIEDVLSKIEDVSEFYFLYNNKLIDVTRKVNIEADKEPIKDILNDILNKDAKFIVYDRQIILTPSDVTSLSTAMQQQRTTGTITDEKGNPLVGVTVLVKGTTTGTLSDASGKYIINNVPQNATLIFSFIGMATQEIQSNGRMLIDVVLKESAIGLEEVVVVGYGTQKSINITGAVASVSANDLKEAPVSQVTQMLQGKLAGVRIQQVTGRPGEGIKVQIRGAASLTSSTNPLYIVDGMPIDGDISFLPPDEIESISVLKDAASASLYGSRAANGVVIVTTKSGNIGKMKVNFNSYYGFEYIPQNRRLKMMDGTEYARFEQEIAIENGRPVNAMWQNPEQYGKGTDWFDLITRSGIIQDHNLTLSAGTEKYRVLVSSDYFSQEGVLKGTGFQRLSFRMNSTFQVTDKLNIGFNIAPDQSYDTNYDTDGSYYGIVYNTLSASPVITPYNEDGSYKTRLYSGAAGFPTPNWLVYIRDKVHQNTNFQLLSNGFVEYEFVKGLIAKATINAQTRNSKMFDFNPSTITSQLNPAIPSGNDLKGNSLNWINENTLTFKKSMGNHNIDALAGFTIQHSKAESTNIAATQYPDDKIQDVSAAGQNVITTSVQEWSLVSFLARLNYDYNGKYLLSASIRRDGSSRFGISKQWGNFPAVSIGWIVSHENFWNSLGIKQVNLFKVRASYGTSGNFEIGNYTHISTIENTYYPFNNTAYTGRDPSNLGDRNLGWEKNKQFNIGADINLFNSRMQFSYSYYLKNTTDLLFSVDVPYSSGFSSVQSNVGKLRFWGHEIELTGTIINKARLKWNTNFNISFDRNKVIDLGTQAGYIDHGLLLYQFRSHRSVVGQPIAMFYGAIWEGVYKNQADFDASPKNIQSAVGTIKFKDVNGDGKITFPEDMTLIGNPWPKFTFGINNNINYGNFDLSFLLTGSYGNKILSFYESWASNLDGVFNVLEEVDHRWKSEADPGDGKYGCTITNTTSFERDRWSTRYLKDGSYISLKNITLGYAFKPFRSNNTRLRLYGTIQNVLIITKYPGPNPEVDQQAYAGGASTQLAQGPLGFKGAMPGFDGNSYPVPRSIIFGINLDF
jgi:TonB-linked SusC/RagA family outer membrane protein